jgi:hypothetical protein
MMKRMARIKRVFIYCFLIKVKKLVGINIYNTLTLYSLITYNNKEITSLHLPTAGRLAITKGYITSVTVQKIKITLAILIFLA